MRKIKKFSKNRGISTVAVGIIVAIIVGVVVGSGVYLTTRPGPRKKPAGVSVENLSLSPSEIKWGESSTAEVDVSNPKPWEETYTTELTIEGEVVDTKSGTLGSGETKTISFDLPEETRKKVGTSTIGIAGMTKSLKVNPRFKIAVVSDVGGRGDLAFNDMAFKGGEDAENKYGVKMMELISYKEADYLPNLRTAADDSDVDLIVGVGFLLSESLNTVAQEYPDKNFMGIDTYAQTLTENVQPNLMDIKFEEHKGSALVGALGACLAAEYDKPHIGAVLGIEIPVLWKFETGYKWGAKWALENWLPANKPGEAFDYTKDFVLYDYSGTFSDVAKGYEYSKPMYEKGAVTVYNVAGPLGLGINRAVKERVPEDQKMGPPFWTGVDANQDWINPGFVITSMMKRVDHGVTYTTKLVKEGKFRDAVEKEDGVMRIGIGTEVLGIPMEGISVSTLADLKEFIEMGVRAEEVTGEKKLPMSPYMIRKRVKEMREAQPDWIWDAVSDLESKIRAEEPIADLDGDGTPETVPRTDEDSEIAYWRDVLG